LTFAPLSPRIVTVIPNPALDRTLTVECMRFNEMTRATTSRLDWGGKGFNISRALRALGAESVAMGFVGGATGQMLERGLKEERITTDFVRVAGETRTNTVITDADGGRYIKVNEAGPRLRTAELATSLDRVHERVRPTDLRVLFGSLPPGVPSDFYAQLIGLVQAAGARALLDTTGEALRLG
jgi:1-phosphofructokinase